MSKSVIIEDAKWRDQLAAMEPQFQMTLPKEISVERFRRAAETAIGMDDKLLKADRKTLFQSLMKCAETGLMPDGRQAALVRFYNSKTKLDDVQFQPMVQGLLELIRNSGEIKDVACEAICENDKCDIQLGDDPHVKHTPDLFDRGDVKAAYCIIKTVSNGIYVEVIDRKSLNKIRNCSQAYRFAESGPANKGGGKKNSPWHLWESEQARKSVIKRASKYAPKSNSRLQKAIDFDNNDYDPAIRFEAPVNQIEQMRTRLQGANGPSDNGADDAETVEPHESEDQANPAQLNEVDFEDQSTAMDVLEHAIASFKTKKDVERYAPIWRNLVVSSFAKDLASETIKNGNALIETRLAEVQQGSGQ